MKNELTREASPEEKVEVVNSILKTFGHDFNLTKESGYFYLEWKNWKGQPVKKRWSGDRSFYPPFYNKLGVGGTVTVAITNLVKFCQGQSVYPLSVWKYWAKIKLWSDQAIAADSIEKLKTIGYPQKPVCIFCQTTIDDTWDWYDSVTLKKTGCACKPSCREQEEWRSRL